MFMGEDMQHLVKEEDQKENCGYCSTPVDSEWKSVHIGDKHYKSTICTKCGKDIMIKVGFLGSGHDSWSEKKKPKKPIDEHIKEVETIKIVD